MRQLQMRHTPEKRKRRGREEEREREREIKRGNGVIFLQQCASLSTRSRLLTIRSFLPLLSFALRLSGGGGGERVEDTRYRARSRFLIIISNDRARTSRACMQSVAWE